MHFIPMSPSLRIACLAGCLTMAFQGNAIATTTTTAALAVSATIASLCVVTGSTMAFGSYSGAAAVTQNATLGVQCTSGTTFNIGLGAGNNGTVAARKMAASAILLNYSLFYDAGMTHNWGTTIGTDTLAGTGTGALVSYTVYGSIPTGQLLASGNYTDSVVVTVTY